MKVSDLRGILQYVPRFREKIFVVAIDGDVVTSENFGNILLDLAGLRSLNIKVILVHGAADYLPVAKSRRMARPAGDQPVKERADAADIGGEGKNFFAGPGTFAQPGEIKHRDGASLVRRQGGSLGHLGADWNSTRPSGWMMVLLPSALVSTVGFPAADGAEEGAAFWAGV